MRSRREVARAAATVGYAEAPVRPSEDTRSHTLAALRRGYVSGRLHTDTFSLRVERAEDCQLVFCDATVSRHHARLELREGRWFLVDLGSSNGTVVNGRRVRDAEVRAGDRVRLGGAGFTL
jgi:pSer/pThr/pTyr-binding forkhead associated (FHA) protein